MTKWHWLTISFGLFLLGIVAIANQGIAFRFLYAIPGADKTGHFFLMGMFAFLINMAMSARTMQLGRYTILKGSFFFAIIVVLEELSQAFLPTRTFSVADLFFDFAGIYCFGQLAAMLVRRHAKPLAGSAI